MFRCFEKFVLASTETQRMWTLSHTSRCTPKYFLGIIVCCLSIQGSLWTQFSPRLYTNVRQKKQSPTPSVAWGTNELVGVTQKELEWLKNTSRPPQHGSGLMRAASMEMRPWSTVHNSLVGFFSLLTACCFYNFQQKPCEFVIDMVS